MDTTDLETIDAAALQLEIQSSPRATKRVLSHLEARQTPHSGYISGSTLAAICGVDSRTWRRWVGGNREFPIAARRLLIAVAFGGAK
jgi:DNA-binding transcriptional regulator YiaG